METKQKMLSSQRWRLRFSSTALGSGAEPAQVTAAGLLSQGARG